MTDGPLSALDFDVAIRVAGRPEPLCAAAFAECDGLEVRLDVERLRDGGSRRQTLLVGGATAGAVTLRRGMTPTLDLWHWMSAVIDDPSLRADATVTMLDAHGAAQVVFALSGCVPVRLRGPRLDATASPIAVEELQLVCEVLELAREEPASSPAAPRAVLRGDADQLEVGCNPSSLRRERGPDGDRLLVDLHVEAPPEGDVREVLAPLDTMYAGRVRFTWGATTFDGRLERVVEEIDHFDAGGRARHATVSLVLAAPS